MYYINLDEVVNVNSLEGALEEFYQDFKYPVYKEKEIPDGAEILKITHSEGTTNTYIYIPTFIRKKTDMICRFISLY